MARQSTSGQAPRSQAIHKPYAQSGTEAHTARKDGSKARRDGNQHREATEQPCSQSTYQPQIHTHGPSASTRGEQASEQQRRNAPMHPCGGGAPQVAHRRWRRVTERGEAGGNLSPCSTHRTRMHSPGVDFASDSLLFHPIFKLTLPPTASLHLPMLSELWWPRSPPCLKTAHARRRALEREAQQSGCPIVSC